MMATSERHEAHHDRARLTEQKQWMISKLRWMGLEQEADRMTAASDTPAAMTVPAETD